MSLSFFLYRRLSRWITCEIDLQNQSKVTLKNKYEVASFKDVFFHPFYWQVSEELHDEIFDSLKSVGLNLAAEPVQANGQTLLVLQRS